MPLPKPSKKQKRDDFISSCMADSAMNKEFSDNKQRYAVCISQWEQEKSKASFVVEAGDYEIVFTDLKEISESAERSGPKSSAQTPAKPSERKKGSEKNEPGSAGKDGKSITFSAKVIEALKNKVKEHNEKYSKKVTLGQLKKVYRRGAGAFSSSHRPGKTRGQWAMARVNMFLKMMRGGDVKKSYKEADQDIAKASENCGVEEVNPFMDFDEIHFQISKLDLIQAGITAEEENEEFEDLEYSEAAKKTLNKPFRLPSGSKKKFGVYVKNPKTGNIIMVKFGDPNMEIRRDDPKARKAFRARHSCDTAKDKTSPKYWSCKMWSQKSVTKITGSESIETDEYDLDNLISLEEIHQEFPELAEITDFISEEDI